ncbi:amidohydrolase family protein [Actinoplanes subtropicus]|uniref:amidohydrolase family protein n=1 Tax=Actinoplanes subtropicus TaxID=543632 RepID=UPI0004C2CBB0|nr:amidohydrolase family protein [Actinoplanes subtropicus]
MTRIDFHVHVLTPGYEQTLAPAPRPPQSISGYKRFMERYEIDAAVLSMGDALQARTASAARTGNEELADVVRAEPHRFGALAIVPFTAQDPEVAITEIAYALDTLALDGVALFSNHAGTYLGDPAWEPVLAELNRRGAYAFVHPAVPANGLVFPQYPRWLFEYPFDTTRALAHLIYSGALERYPQLRLQFAHLGGSSLFLAHRLASLAEREPEKATRAPKGAMEYLRRQYFDTGLSNNTVALASTLKATALDHIVFGSDWPYLAEPAGSDPSDDFDELDPAVRVKIDVENAAALVPRLLHGR